MKIFQRAITPLLNLLILGCFTIAIGFIVLESRLPDVDTLKNVQLQAPLRIYTNDGQLIAEYGEKRRIPITLNEAPKQLIQAILATEDQRFFEHAGVDFIGLMRAVSQLVTTGIKSQGGSTITMQVARNFFLSRKKTFSRKINEILLAIKIERELGKDKILELYLNKIYFGNRAYGVAAAAQVYYGKTLNELTLEQLAMIAGLPKAPSAHNPLADPVAALRRRNFVLSRMYELDYITQEQYQTAVSAPDTAKYHMMQNSVDAPYVAEMVRNTIVLQYGNGAYTRGLQVYTTIDAKTQQVAEQAVKNGLLQYDQRHGYRGPEESLGVLTGNLDEWQNHLAKMAVTNGLEPAAVVSIGKQSVTALRQNGELVTIAWSGLEWARRQLDQNYRGPKPQIADDIVNIGDVIRINRVNNDWQLAQIPKVQGALVALNPQDGSIKSLIGGFDFALSNFNHATQAMRQPGSSFKPFIYSAALAKNFTLASIINDAPVVLPDTGENASWRPQNDTRKFYGPTRLRIGLTRSRNLVSIRLLENIGIPYTIQYLSRFGFDPKYLPNSLSLALGSALVTPLQMASGYAVFANGGYKIIPHVISRITDLSNQTLFEAKPLDPPTDTGDQADPNQAPQVISPQVAYLMNMVLQDVIQHGTGRAALKLKRSDLAGKTGTTNDKIDAWFTGYNSSLVSVVWTGFDQPNSLYEYGAQIALPIWIDFMNNALKGLPEQSLKQPPGIVAVRIDPTSGLATKASDKKTIFEYFRAQNAPTAITQKNDNLPQQNSVEAKDINELF